MIIAAIFKSEVAFELVSAIVSANHLLKLAVSFASSGTGQNFGFLGDWADSFLLGDSYFRGEARSCF